MSLSTIFQIKSFIVQMIKNLDKTLEEYIQFGVLNLSNKKIGKRFLEIYLNE